MQIKILISHSPHFNTSQHHLIFTKIDFTKHMNIQYLRINFKMPFISFCTLFYTTHINSIHTHFVWLLLSRSMHASNCLISIYLYSHPVHNPHYNLATTYIHVALQMTRNNVSLAKSKLSHIK